MAFTLLVTFTIALALAAIAYVYARSLQRDEPEDLAQLVQDRRPPVTDSIERLNRSKNS